MKGTNGCEKVDRIFVVDLDRSCNFSQASERLVHLKNFIGQPICIYNQASVPHRLIIDVIVCPPISIALDQQTFILRFGNSP